MYGGDIGGGGDGGGDGTGVWRTTIAGGVSRATVPPMAFSSEGMKVVAATTSCTTTGLSSERASSRELGRVGRADEEVGRRE